MYTQAYNVQGGGGGSRRRTQDKVDATVTDIQAPTQLGQAKVIGHAHWAKQVHVTVYAHQHMQMHAHHTHAHQHITCPHTPYMAV
jgi:hypothetical protein